MKPSRKEVNGALRLSHVTLEHAPDAVLWIDAQADIRRVNRAACLLFGYRQNELLGAKISAFYADETEEAWRARWEEMESQQRVMFERELLTKAGRRLTVEVRANFIEFEGEEYACLFLRDITEWKRAEENLQESQRALSTLINNLPGAVYRSKPDDALTFEFITEWSRRITGYPPDALIESRQLSSLDLIHPEDRQLVVQYIRDVVNSGKPGRLIYRIMTANQEIKWISNRFRGIYAEDGAVIAIEGYFNDMTDQMMTEAALKEALDEVERLKNQLEEENIYLRQEIKFTYNFEEILSQNVGFHLVLQQVQQVAPTDATVLILGETGTGKELIAREIHNLSGRKTRSLVKVNCAALPANLIESELFGHEKGAFTGAIALKIGRFELADHGTIFLDEIGDLPLDLQVKLLRVLQEGEFDRLGDPRTHHVDARVIAATNRDLDQAMKNGTFREDLFYRLNVFPIHVPPLRERKDDIPLLVEHFLRRYCKKTGRSISVIPQKAMDTLQAYPWPGNVRELENIIERAVILSRGTRLELGDWFSSQDVPAGVSEILTLEESERRHILKALELTRWRVSGDKGAAKILRIHPQTLVSRMKKLGIRRPV